MQPIANAQDIEAHDHFEHLTTLKWASSLPSGPTSPAGNAACDATHHAMRTAFDKFDVAAEQNDRFASRYHA